MNDTIHFSDYAVGFVDLLGQKDEYRNQNLLPRFDSPQDEEVFKQKARKTIGAIYELQNASRTFLDTALNPKSLIREWLPEEGKAIHDQMRITALKIQMWSDGVVYFSSLGDTNVKVPMNALFNIIAAIGSLCFLGLATKHPVRGGLEIAWGTELTPNNLYGCAVAKAYELESEIAQYPRIVVGPYFINRLQAYSNNSNSDTFAKLNKVYADACLQLLLQDVDGHFIIHYLGNTFQKDFSSAIHQKLYDDALRFIHTSLDKFRLEKNTKLSMRYMLLLNYFEDHRPYQ